VERDKAEDEEIDTWLNLEHEVELHSSKLSNTSDNPSTIRPTPKKKQIQILIVLRSTPMNTCTQSGNSAGGIRGQYDKNKVYNSGSTVCCISICSRMFRRNAKKCHFRGF
jgi:hypothetical protein